MILSLGECVCNGEGDTLNRRKREFSLRLKHGDFILKGPLLIMGRGKSYEHSCWKLLQHHMYRRASVTAVSHLNILSQDYCSYIALTLRSWVKCHLLREIFPDYPFYLKYLSIQNSPSLMPIIANNFSPLQDFSLQHFKVPENIICMCFVYLFIAYAF